MLDLVVTDTSEIQEFTQGDTKYYAEKIALNIEENDIPVNYGYNVNIDDIEYKGYKYSLTEATSYKTKVLVFADGTKHIVADWSISTIPNSEDTTIYIFFNYQTEEMETAEHTVSINQIKLPFNGACGGVKLNRENWNALYLKESDALFSLTSSALPEDGIFTVCGQYFSSKDFKAIKSQDGLKVVITSATETDTDNEILSRGIAANCGGLLVDSKHFSVNENGELGLI